MNKLLFLQLFADSDEDGTDGNGSGTGGEKKTFEDLLRDKEYLAEFDRRVQEACKTAVGNAERKWKALTDDKLSEAEKLAQMTREEKAEYRQKQLEKELADLKRQNAKTELAKTARKMLSEHEINIPDEILNVLVSEDAETTKSSVEAFSTMFSTAVQNAVREALKGKTPKKGSTSNITKKEIMAVENRAERQKLIQENIELFIGGN